MKRGPRFINLKRASNRFMKCQPAATISKATAKSKVCRKVNLVDPSLELVASDICVKPIDGQDFRTSGTKGHNHIKYLELVGAAFISEPLIVVYLFGIHCGHGPGRVFIKRDRLRYIREVFKDGLYSDGQEFADWPLYSTGGSVENIK